MMMRPVLSLHILGKRHPLLARTFSQSCRLPEESDDNHKYNAQRVWKAGSTEPSFWTHRLIDLPDKAEKELEDYDTEDEGTLRIHQLGVLHADPATDMQLLVDNYTVKAVASALRDREDALQYAATLASEQEWDELAKFLKIYHPKYVLERRRGGPNAPPSVVHSLDVNALQVIRKALMRMPRTVTQAHARRAGVVLALCLCDGVPSILLEKRADSLRSHPGEVGLPGGMICTVTDHTIISTCLRELNEEIGGLTQDPDVLGVFRCHWGEVHHLVGVAVTPVVCFFGELPSQLYPNPDEVSEVFTISLKSLLDQSMWVHKEGHAPIFLGGPHIIWGLTGYILERFAKDILKPNSREITDKKAADLIAKASKSSKVTKTD